MIIGANGVRLFTRRIGVGPLVIVLHGGPGAHHDYLLPQYDLLARGRTLLYYDQRGGGRSPVPRDTPVGWREHVADLDAVRLSVSEERVTLCGYSWGGLLAVLYFLEHPNRVEQLALVAPAPLAAEYRREFEAELERRAASPAIAGAREALRTSDLRDRDPDAYRRRSFELSVAAYFRDPADAQRLTPFRVTARTQQAVWRSLGEYDLRDRLRQAPHPLPPSVVLHGASDPLPIAASRELATLLGARLVELRTGHCPHVEATDAFVETLDGFLPRT